MLADIAKQIAQDVSGALERAKADAPINSAQFQTLLQSALRQCNVVTREEFDAQSAVLMRTREKLEALEKQVTSLEDTINQQATPND